MKKKLRKPRAVKRIVVKVRIAQLGVELKHNMDTKDMSNVEFAKKVDMSPAALSRILNGHPPGLRGLVLILMEMDGNLSNIAAFIDVLPSRKKRK